VFRYRYTPAGEKFVMTHEIIKMRSLKITFSSGIIFLLLVASLYSEQNLFIHAEGFGPVKIGMTVPQASKALGTALKPVQPLDEDEIHCHYVYPDGNYRLIGFMVEGGTITRVDVHRGSYFTDTGIKVGDNEKKIYEQYKGRITEKIHPYIGKDGKYLIVDTIKEHQMIFETDRGIITSLRTGKLPSVAYIEGCL
jgi:hypothetical protein